MDGEKDVIDLHGIDAKRMTLEILLLNRRNGKEANIENHVEAVANGVKGQIVKVEANDTEQKYEA
jgi:hypothetical protein